MTTVGRRQHGTTKLCEYKLKKYQGEKIKEDLRSIEHKHASVMAYFKALYLISYVVLSITYHNLHLDTVRKC
jgi:hypothetical protein